MRCGSAALFHVCLALHCVSLLRAAATPLSGVEPASHMRFFTSWAPLAQAQARTARL